ncbi:hypothetical protein Patl1_03578 [Pistacia atlantica]|uniref:Uncharacterized protein n=1 Tax=Pistacia atlantica TaxID=434234 RepID=A0ACC1CBF0_9ROSI|nr:hypothetical protein Patl1_03578 [Pistacia atlantica]
MMPQEIVLEKMEPERLSDSVNLLLSLQLKCLTHYRAKMEEYQPGSQPEPNNGLTAESLRVFQEHSD